MNNEVEQIKVYVMIGTIVMLLVIFSGITYAFFSASNNKGSTSIISATSGKMTISYADGKSSLLVSKDIVPSNKIIIDKTFTLTGTNTTSGLAMPYKVGLNYISEFSDGQIHYYIKQTNTNTNVTSTLVGTGNQTTPGNTTETGYISGTLMKGNRYLELATGEFKANTSNQTITFNLKIQFPDTGENQDSEKGKTLTGEIVVNYEESATDTLIALYDKETKTNNVSTSGLYIDNTKDVNLRYTGANPNNYVIFGNDSELWRIVGIFNVTDSEGNTTRKIKLVRDESLGQFSWDARYNNQTSDYRGINDWNTATIMQELNGDYLNYNLTANTNWYNNYWSDGKAYERQTGVFNYNYTIKEKYQGMISEAIWYTGGNIYTNLNLESTLPTLGQYNAERESKLYLGDTNNNVTRTLTWTGKIGLIYASDYGYASTDKECHKDLRAGQLYDKESDSYNYENSKCKNNNWLYNGLVTWTLSTSSGASYIVFDINDFGIINSIYTGNLNDIYPSVYLKSNVNITSGTGTSTDPYKLG